MPTLCISGKVWVTSCGYQFLQKILLSKSLQTLRGPDSGSGFGRGTCSDPEPEVGEDQDSELDSDLDPESDAKEEAPPPAPWPRPRPSPSPSPMSRFPHIGGRHAASIMVMVRDSSRRDPIIAWLVVILTR